MSNFVDHANCWCLPKHEEQSFTNFRSIVHRMEWEWNCILLYWVAGKHAYIVIFRFKERVWVCVFCVFVLDCGKQRRHFFWLASVRFVRFRLDKLEEIPDKDLFLYSLTENAFHKYIPLLVFVDTLFEHFSWKVNLDFQTVVLADIRGRFKN